MLTGGTAILRLAKRVPPTGPPLQGGGREGGWKASGCWLGFSSSDLQGLDKPGCALS